MRSSLDRIYVYNELSILIISVFPSCPESTYIMNLTASFGHTHSSVLPIQY